MTAPWEGHDPTEAPPVGTVLVALVKIAPRAKGPVRRVCIVDESGTVDAREQGGRLFAWAAGRWQLPSGGWSKPSRMLIKPWLPHQLEAPL